MEKVTLWIARGIVLAAMAIPVLAAVAIALTFMTAERIQRQKVG